jgi:hypothetical protein
LHDYNCSFKPVGHDTANTFKHATRLQRLPYDLQLTQEEALRKPTISQTKAGAYLIRTVANPQTILLMKTVLFWGMSLW